MMDVKELRELSLEELERKLGELRDDLFKLRLRASSTQLENPARIRQIRRAIARGETVRGEVLRRQAGQGAEQTP